MKLSEGLTHIGNWAFIYCRALDNVIIPSSVTDIGESAFHGCGSLSSIVIPEGITTIRSSLFSFCTNLKKVTIPDSVTVIEGGAFDGCQSLEEIYIPDGVTEISGSVFSNCGSLTQIDIPDGVTVIGMSAFRHCKALQEIIIPAGVTSIGPNAFLECDGLTEIAIPKGISELPDYIFYGCEKLADIELPEGITRIGASAFGLCASLEKIDIPATVTEIGESAFESCRELDGVVIPAGVSRIGSRAFYACENLKSIKIPNTASYGSGVFDGVSMFGECTSLAHVELPDSWTAITDHMFYACSALTDISDLLDGKTSIGRAAFQECTGLIEVTIPASVSELCSTFSGCTNLRTIYFEGDAPQMDMYCFSEVTATVYIMANNETWTEDVKQDYYGDLTWRLPCAGEHTTVEIPGAAATCTQSGLTTAQHCEACGLTVVKQEVIPAIGHSFGEWIETKPATTSETGTAQRDCINCGKAETKPLPKLESAPWAMIIVGALLVLGSGAGGIWYFLIRKRQR